MKIIIFIDVQNDFIDGALPADPNREITRKIAKYAYINKCEHIPMLATRDTHYDESVLWYRNHSGYYENTLEGERLPIKHCISGTTGHEIAPELMENLSAYNILEKHTFGLIDDLRDKIDKIANYLDELYNDTVTEIELAGFCTDICVVSNALILRAMYPNTRITVLQNLCAGSTPEKHAAALDVMRSCQIDVKNAEV